MVKIIQIWAWHVAASLKLQCLNQLLLLVSVVHSIYSCSLPPRDSYQLWRFLKSMHTHIHIHTLPVIAYFLPAFIASVAPGFTRQGLLSYTLTRLGRAARRSARKSQNCFYFVLLGVRLYEDCQHFFDSGLKAVQAHMKDPSVCRSPQSFPS